MSADDVSKVENRAEALVVDLLQRLGYRAVTAAEVETERADTGNVALVHRIHAALRRLNPGLSDDQVRAAARAVTHTDVTSLIDANRDVYTALTMGVTPKDDCADENARHPVRYFDFDQPHHNDFAVARELWIEGGRVRLDLVLFVNGVPLVVIECRGAAKGDLWRAAIQQLSRYQESGEQARRLFSTVQVVVVASIWNAVYGTVGTSERSFSEWRDPFPRTMAEIEQELGRKASAQDVLLYGLLAPANLLDVFRNFTLFDAGSASNGPRKLLAHYYQFRAVNTALARIAGSKTPAGRGGIIWHSQGSGKGLTMLWLALKLKRDPRYQNPTIVVVTDRLTQEEQLASTFRRCGAPNVVSADSAAHLRELLGAPTGGMVTTTIQKFGSLAEEMRTGGEGAVSIMTLSTSSDLFVLIEEAHRTQDGSLAAKMRAALPNACFIGFTATPLSRQDRSTLHVFGPYIDVYSLQESIRDGTTVPIFFERRLPKLRTVQPPEDRTAEADLGVEGAGEIKGTLAAALERIEAISTDLLEHYRSVIQPGGFKALIVAVNRRAAIAYKETLDRRHGPESAVLISGTASDPDATAKHVMHERQRARTIERFLDPQDPLSILVVCEVLLTGFDAPVLQVLYLDAPLREHALLQAVARVNRAAENKVYGLVVDYWGISSKLREALAIFSTGDVKDAMTPKSEELQRLQGRHAAALRFFLRVPDKGDLDACVAVLASEGARAEFNAAFHRFAQSLEVMLPDPKSLSYADDLRWIVRIRETAGARYEDEALQILDVGAKVKRLIGQP